MRAGRAALVCVIVVCGVSAAAQARHPDFSGTWVAVDSQTPAGPSLAFAAGRTLTVEQDAAMLRFEQTDVPARGMPERLMFSYALDDRPSRNIIEQPGTGGFIEYLSYASWQGAALIIRTTVVRHTEQAVTPLATLVDVWTLRADGRLVIEVTPRGGAGSFLRTVYARK
jgi:hypothetical protein